MDYLCVPTSHSDTRMADRRLTKSKNKRLENQPALATKMAIGTVPIATIATMPTLCVAAVLYVFFSFPRPFSLSSFCMVSWL